MFPLFSSRPSLSRTTLPPARTHGHYPRTHPYNHMCTFSQIQLMRTHSGQTPREPRSHTHPGGPSHTHTHTRIVDVCRAEVTTGSCLSDAHQVVPVFTTMGGRNGGCAKPDAIPPTTDTAPRTESASSDEKLGECAPAGPAAASAALPLAAAMIGAGVPLPARVCDAAPCPRRPPPQACALVWSAPPNTGRCGTRTTRARSWAAA